MYSSCIVCEIWVRSRPFFSIFLMRNSTICYQLARIAGSTYFAALTLYLFATISNFWKTKVACYFRHQVINILYWIKTLLSAQSYVKLCRLASQNFFKVYHCSQSPLQCRRNKLFSWLPRAGLLLPSPCLSLSLQSYFCRRHWNCCSQNVLPSFLFLTSGLGPLVLHRSEVFHHLFYSVNINQTLII